jgi:predicted DNA-binding transcriptional regulator AlpA
MPARKRRPTKARQSLKASAVTVARQSIRKGAPRRAKRTLSERQFELDLLQATDEDSRSTQRPPSTQEPPAATFPDQLVGLEDVLRLTRRRHRCTVYRWIKQGRFPKKREIGGGTGWLRSDIVEWMSTLKR